MTVGPLCTNVAIPLLLGTFYALLGTAHLALSPAAAADEPWLKPRLKPAPPARPRAAAAATRLLTPAPGSPAARRASELAATAAAAFGALSANLGISALLFRAEAPAGAIAAVLAALAAGNFAVFELRRERLAALAAAVAVVAPLSELLFMAPPLEAAPPLWHYTAPDLFVLPGEGGPGLVSWVPLCYFFYVPAVGCLARALAAAAAEEATSSSSEGGGGGTAPGRVRKP